MEITIDLKDETEDMALRFTYADTSATVTLGDEKIGELRGCLGGGIEIHINSPKKQFFLDPQELFKIVLDQASKQG